MQKINIDPKTDTLSKFLKIISNLFTSRQLTNDEIRECYTIGALSCLITLLINIPLIFLHIQEPLHSYGNLAVGVLFIIASAGYWKAKNLYDWTKISSVLFLVIGSLDIIFALATILLIH